MNIEFSSWLEQMIADNEIGELAGWYYTTRNKPSNRSVAELRKFVQAEKSELIEQFDSAVKRYNAEYPSEELKRFEPPETMEAAKEFILRRVVQDSKECLVTRHRELRRMNGSISVEIDEIWYPGLPERLLLVAALDEMISDGLFTELMKDNTASVFRETYQLTWKGLQSANKLGIDIANRKTAEEDSA